LPVSPVQSRFSIGVHLVTQSVTSLPKAVFTHAISKELYKSLRMFLTVWVLLVACWTPYLIVTNDHLPSRVDHEDIEYRSKAEVLLLLANLHSGLNAIIYPLCNKNFRTLYWLKLKQLNPFSTRQSGLRRGSDPQQPEVGRVRRESEALREEIEWVMAELSSDKMKKENAKR
jgi:hypothetical protein